MTTSDCYPFLMSSLTSGTPPIRVTDEKLNTPIPSAVVSLNNESDTGLVTNELGEVIFEKKDISSIEVAYLGEFYVWDFSDELEGDLNVLLTEKDIK